MTECQWQKSGYENILNLMLLKYVVTYVDALQTSLIVTGIDFSLAQLQLRQYN